MQTYTVLDSIGALADQYLNLILVDMLTPILLPEQVDKIVSTSWSEGRRVVLRRVVFIISHNLNVHAFTHVVLGNTCV